MSSATPRASRDDRAVVAGAGTNLLGSVGKALVAAVYAVASRGFGSAAFGLASLVTTPVEVLSSLVSAGLGDAVLRFAARDPEREPATTTHHAIIARALIWATGGGLVVALVLAALSGPICGAFWHRPDASRLLILAAANVPLLAPLSIVLTACRSVLDMKGDALVRGAVSPIGLFVFTVAAMLVPGLRSALGLLVALTLSNVIALIVALVYLQRHYRWGALWRARREAVPAGLIRFAVPQSIGFILWHGIWEVGLAVLGTVANDDTVGLYRLGCELARAGISVRYLFSDVYAPLVARYAREGAGTELRASLARVSRWAALIAAPVTVAILVGRDTILGIINPVYVGRAGFLSVLVLGPLINSFTGLVGNLLVMTGHNLVQLASVAAAFVVNAVLCVLLAPRLGAMGVAIAALAAFTTLALANLVLLWRIFAVGLDWLGVAMPLVVAGALGTGTFIAAGRLALVIPGRGASTIAVVGFLLAYAVVLRVAARAEDRALIAGLFRRGGGRPR